MFTDIEFWKNFVSNAFATIVGVIIGIPIALWLNNFQEHLKEKERKKKILRLLKKELLVAQLELIGLENSKSKVEESLLLFTTLKDEMWKAFSDGGELEWIKDLELLDDVSEAYYSIRAVMQVSEKGFDLIMFSNDKVSVATKEGFIVTLQHGIEYSKDMLAQALVKIEKEI